MASVSRQRVAVIDVDHTLADAVWRDHLIGGEGGWDAYHRDSHQDLPIEEMVAVIRCLHASGWTLIAMTCRHEKWREQTIRWMAEHDIPIDEVIMRADGEFRSSAELKPIMLRERFPDLSHVDVVIEDRGDVAAALVEENVTVLQVHARRSRR